MSEMLNRNGRVPHPMEIYPGASDLHTLGTRTEGLWGYPALTHTLLYYLHVTTQAEHTLEKMSSKTEWAARTGSMARKRALLYMVCKDVWPHSTV